MSFERVADLNDLWIGELRAVRAAGAPVLLVRLDQGVFAYDDRCPHQSFPLSRGALDGSTLRCAAHGWEFDLATGEGVNPRACALRRVPLRIEGGGVWVEAEGTR